MPGVAIAKHLPGHPNQLPSFSGPVNITFISLLAQDQVHGFDFFFSIYLLYAGSHHLSIIVFIHLLVYIR